MRQADRQIRRGSVGDMKGEALRLQPSQEGAGFPRYGRLGRVSFSETSMSAEAAQRPPDGHD
jgi:hypothetical protein